MRNAERGVRNSRRGARGGRTSARHTPTIGARPGSVRESPDNRLPFPPTVLVTRPALISWAINENRTDRKGSRRRRRQRSVSEPGPAAVAGVDGLRGAPNGSRSDPRTPEGAWLWAAAVGVGSAVFGAANLQAAPLGRRAQIPDQASHRIACRFRRFYLNGVIGPVRAISLLPVPVTTSHRNFNHH